MSEGKVADKAADVMNAFLVTSDARGDSDLVRVLESAGFGVTVLKGFADVRAAARERAPDIIILCTRGALGPELALYSSLRAIIDDRFVPFVVLADTSSAEEEVMALSAGVDAFLTGPVHPMLLSARLHSLLRIKGLHDELVAANARLQELSRIDPGTGLHNRRYFFERLEEEFARVKRHKANLSVIMLDIDDFKAVNDIHGHLFGDHVLKKLADILQATSRRIDIVARYGGEEFAFILPDTPILAATNLAERVRRTVASTTFRQDDAEMRITVSLGVAEVTQCGADDTDQLVKAADQALYEAKAKGRNRLAVCASGRDGRIASEPPAPAEP